MGKILFTNINIIHKMQVKFGWSQFVDAKNKINKPQLVLKMLKITQQLFPLQIHKKVKIQNG
jgi:hypothetical protein